MNMPGFSAEASLRETFSQYRPATPHFVAANGGPGSEITPSFIVGGTHPHTCPSGYIWTCDWVLVGVTFYPIDCGCKPAFLPFSVPAQTS